MQVKIRKLRDDAILPTYATAGCAGMDLYAVEDVILRPNVPTLVHTGIAIELPPGYEAQIRPRSGLALKHGIGVGNAPGTVDSDYRGDVGVILLWCGYRPPGNFSWPLSNCESEDEIADSLYRIHAGDRIAQMVVARHERVEWTGSDLSESGRGAGGFGSSGK